MSEPMADANDEDGRSRRFWVLVALVGLGLQVILVVIVGAAVSTYLLGLGTPVPAGPTAAFDGDAVNGSYVLTHDGGDAITASHVAVRRNGEDVGAWAELSSTTEADERVAAGDGLRLPKAEAGDTITVLWNGEDNSAVLFEDEVGPLRTPTPTSTATETSQPPSKPTGTPQSAIGG